MFRQRQLERSGLVFWRVSESNFRFDPVKAMAGLWLKLDEMGIQPLFTPSTSPMVSVTDQALGERLHVQPEAQRLPGASIQNGGVKKPDNIEPKPSQSLFAASRQHDLAPSSKHPGERQEELPMPVQQNESELAKFDPIQRLILEELSGQRRQERMALQLKISRRLGLTGEDRRRVEKAIEKLERAGIIKGGVNYVELSG